MIRRPPRSTRVRSSAASDVYKQDQFLRGDVVERFRGSPGPEDGRGAWEQHQQTQPRGWVTARRRDQSERTPSVEGKARTKGSISSGVGGSQWKVIRRGKG